jgi:hypothetical protein
MPWCGCQHPSTICKPRYAKFLYAEGPNFRPPFLSKGADLLNQDFVHFTVLMEMVVKSVRRHIFMR